MLNLGNGGYANREILFCRLDGRDLRLDLDAIQSRFFSVLLVIESTMARSQSRELLDRLGSAGACWLTICSSDAEAQADYVYGIHDRSFPRQTHVTATWHTRDQLDDAVETFLWSSVPDDAAHDQCGSALVIAVGGVAFSQEICESVVAELAS